MIISVSELAYSRIIPRLEGVSNGIPATCDIPASYAIPASINPVIQLSDMWSGSRDIKFKLLQVKALAASSSPNLNPDEDFPDVIQDIDPVGVEIF